MYGRRDSVDEKSRQSLKDKHLLRHAHNRDKYTTGGG